MPTALSVSPTIRRTGSSSAPRSKASAVPRAYRSSCTSEHRTPRLKHRCGFPARAEPRGSFQTTKQVFQQRTIFLQGEIGELQSARQREPLQFAVLVVLYDRFAAFPKGHGVHVIRHRRGRRRVPVRDGFQCCVSDRHNTDFLARLSNERVLERFTLLNVAAREAPQIGISLPPQATSCRRTLLPLSSKA